MLETKLTSLEIKMLSKEARKQLKAHLPLATTQSKIEELYKDRKYLDVIKLVEITGIFSPNKISYLGFNEQIYCIIYAGISYIELEEFEKAIKCLFCVKQKLHDFKKTVTLWKETNKRPKSDREFKVSETILPILKDQINDFYSYNYVKYLSNLAYAYYENKQYKKAITHYKRALKNDPRNVQYNLGIAQAQYRLYDSNVPDEILEEYKKTLEMLKKQQTSFDILLAIGKMYYFLGEYSKALLYLQLALDSEENESNRVHAYDWLSRVAFKTKNHSAAVTFYEKTISTLIEHPNCKQTEVIHPRPKLHKMVEYLNTNKKILNTEELKWVTRSIYWGIGVTAFFGVIESIDKFKSFFTILFKPIIWLCTYIVAQSHHFESFLNKFY